jgi:hypothetical protein
MNLKYSKSIVSVFLFILFLGFTSCSSSAFLSRRYTPGTFVEQTETKTDSSRALAHRSRFRHEVLKSPGKQTTPSLVIQDQNKTGGIAIEKKKETSSPVLTLKRLKESLLERNQMKAIIVQEKEGAAKEQDGGWMTKARLRGLVAIGSTFSSYFLLLLCELSIFPTPVLIFIYFLVFIGCLLGLIMAIVSMRTARNNGERAPVSGILALVFSLIEITVALLLLLLVLLLVGFI